MPLNPLNDRPRSLVSGRLVRSRYRSPTMSEDVFAAMVLRWMAARRMINPVLLMRAQTLGDEIIGPRANHFDNTLVWAALDKNLPSTINRARVMAFDVTKGWHRIN